MAISPSHNVSLQPYSGMATPAVAHQLVAVATVDELIDALRLAKENRLKPLIIGEGSNTVFKTDFHGLVIVNRLPGRKLIVEDDTHVVLQVGAGENWHDLVSYTVHQGWYGLENLALIPGSVGAAPVQNIGAYGVELGEFVECIEILDIETLKPGTLTAEDCRFGYRDSVFKQELRDKVVVTSVTLRLNKVPRVNVSYDALREFLNDGDVSPEAVFAAVCEIRSRKLPLPSEIPNCGSFFKNPVVSRCQFEAIRQRHPEIRHFPEGGNIKLAAAWMIDQAGWKAKPLQGVSVHDQQALVIVNPEHKAGTLVCDLAESIRADIQARFGVTLEIEPQIIQSTA